MPWLELGLASLWPYLSGKTNPGNRGSLYVLFSAWLPKSLNLTEYHCLWGADVHNFVVSIIAHTFKTSHHNDICIKESMKPY